MFKVQYEGGARVAPVTGPVLKGKNSEDAQCRF